MIATNSTATNNWVGTNGIFTANSYWPANGSASPNPPAPVVLVAAVVSSGTNPPEGVYASGKGSVYNQFDVTGTNVLQQWIKTTPSGNTGWVTNSFASASFVASAVNGLATTNYVIAATNGLTTMDQSFASSVGITDQNVKKHLGYAQAELNTFNVMSNIVEMVPMQSWFNPLAGKTYFGRTINYSNNAVQFMHGVMFSNSLATIDGLPNLRTNTIFIVFNLPSPIYTNQSFGTRQFIAGLFNTNTKSYFGLGVIPGSGALVTERSGSTPLPSDGLTNQGCWLRPDANYDPTVEGAQQPNRVVVAISSDGNGSQTFYGDGVQGKIGSLAGSTFIFHAPASTNTDALTQLRIGNDPIVNAFYNPSAQGVVVQSVFIANCVANSNLCKAICRAAECLELDDEYNDYSSDSRFLPSPSPTNTIPWFFQREKPFNNLWRVSGIGGMALLYPIQVAFGGITNSPYYWSVGHAPSIKATLTTGLGYNDISIYTNTADMVMTNLAILQKVCADHRTELNYICPWISSTNVVSQTIDSNIVRLTTLVRQTAYNFANVSYFSMYVTQTTMDTNAPVKLTDDYVHWMRLNSAIINSKPAIIGWNKVPQYDYDGNLVLSETNANPWALVQIGGTNYTLKVSGTNVFWSTP
ncbi:MAG TPA: hypothetical protein VGO57_02165 [Verrucomicrobiae bacterium]